MNGVASFGMPIGVEVKGRPSVGVVYLPALDEMVAAATGVGCRWNGRPALVSSVSQLSAAAIMLTGVGTMMSGGDVYARLASATRFQHT